MMSAEIDKLTTGSLTHHALTYAHSELSPTPLSVEQTTQTAERSVSYYSNVLIKQIERRAAELCGVEERLYIPAIERLPGPAHSSSS